MAKRVSLKGKGADLFFGDYPPPSPPAPADEADGVAPADPGAEPDVSRPPAMAAETTDDATPLLAPEAVPPSPARARTPRRPAEQPPEPSKLARKRVSELASNPANDEDERIEAIRQVVKTPGREVSFVRLSPGEKGELADVVYTYKRQGLKTTETEINRIAINSLLADYRTNGEQSVLAKVLAALRA